MEVSTDITIVDPNGSIPRSVRVRNREEVGTAIQSKQIGGGNTYVAAVLVHFESTGECIWYAQPKVQFI